MRVINLGSGSKGNCTIIEHQNTVVMVDAGLPIKELETRILEAKVDLTKLTAIIVSHNHIDHIRSVSKLANKYRVNVYAPEICYQDEVLNKIVFELKHNLPEEVFDVGEIKIKAFDVPHDALKTVGFNFFADGNKVSLLTDVGKLSEQIFSNIVNSNLVMIESNYDVKMLDYGPYPFSLKKRIKSGMGHLSNAECAENILKLSKTGIKYFMLMHLSEINNTPQVAYNTVMNVLASEYGDEIPARILLSSQHKISPNFIFNTRE